MERSCAGNPPRARARRSWRFLCGLADARADLSSPGGTFGHTTSSALPDYHATCVGDSFAGAWRVLAGVTVHTYRSHSVRDAPEPHTGSARSSTKRSTRRHAAAPPDHEHQQIMRRSPRSYSVWTTRIPIFLARFRQSATQVN